MSTSARIRRRWTSAEDQSLREEAGFQMTEGAVRDWNRVAAKLPGRTNKDCRKRWAKLSETVKKGKWEPDEDVLLREGVETFGTRWTQVAQVVGTRHADQCAKRWTHSLDPNIDHSEWKEDEENRLLAAVATYGRDWRRIAEAEFPSRSKLDLKNRYAVLGRRHASEVGHGSTTNSIAGSSSASHMPNAAARESMSILDDSDSSEDEGIDETGPYSQCPMSGGASPHRRGDMNGVEDSDFWSLLSLPLPSSFVPPVPPMLPIDKDTTVSGGRPDRMEGLLLSQPGTLPGSSAATMTDNDYMNLMAMGMDMPMMANSTPFESLPQLNRPPCPLDTVALLRATTPTQDLGMDMPPLPHSKSLPHTPATPLSAVRSTRSTGTSTPTSRTTIELENVPQDTLSRIMDVLFQARTKVRMETTHQDRFPGDMSGD